MQRDPWQPGVSPAAIEPDGAGRQIDDRQLPDATPRRRLVDLQTSADLAECECPGPCLRDHEND